MRRNPSWQVAQRWAIAAVWLANRAGCQRWPNALLTTMYTFERTANYFQIYCTVYTLVPLLVTSAFISY